jgi:hypothetical protein
LGADEEDEEPFPFLLLDAVEDREVEEPRREFVPAVAE